MLDGKRRRSTTSSRYVVLRYYSNGSEQQEASPIYRLAPVRTVLSARLRSCQQQRNFHDALRSTRFLPSQGCREMHLGTAIPDVANAAFANVKNRNNFPEVKKLFPIGKCLRRKVTQRPYSAYSVKCPRCGAEDGYKCVGIRGVLSPIPHVTRELQAAEAYRLARVAKRPSMQGGR